MELKELKCKNCGAKLEVEEGATEVTCKFCGTTFSIDDAYTQGYKYTKGVLKAQSEQMEENLNTAQEFLKNSSFGKTSKVFSVVFATIFILIFVLFNLRLHKSYICLFRLRLKREILFSFFDVFRLYIKARKRALSEAE